MKKFPCLRSFLLFKDTSYHYDRFLFEGYKTGPKFVAFYDKAKASWEKYGDNPPFGSKVRTLRDGFGGPEGSIRLLKGIAQDDDRFFVLERKIEEKNFFSGTKTIKTAESWSTRNHWWAEFEVIEDGKS